MTYDGPLTNILIIIISKGVWRSSKPDDITSSLNLIFELCIVIRRWFYHLFYINQWVIHYNVCFACSYMSTMNKISDITITIHTLCCRCYCLLLIRSRCIPIRWVWLNDNRNRIFRHRFAMQKRCLFMRSRIRLQRTRI